VQFELACPGRHVFDAPNRAEKADVDLRVAY